MSQAIVKDLVAHFKSDIPAGIAYADSQLNILLPRVAEDRLIQSTVEGNTFRWSEEGMTARDWFSIWAKVKEGLEDCLNEVRPSRGVFSPSFCSIEH